MTIEVDYRFPPGIDAERQAKTIAIGQTAGTWDARFEHREAVMRSHLGKVVDIRTDETGHATATVAFPEANVEHDIPSPKLTNPKRLPNPRVPKTPPTAGSSPWAIARC